MNHQLQIMRIGSAHGSPGRYIDVAKSPKVKSLTWIARRGDTMVSRIFEYGRKNSSDFREKFKVIYFDESLRFRIVTKLLRLSERTGNLARLFYYPLFLISRFMYLPEISKSLIADVDFIWAGNNDSDGITQILLCYSHQFDNVPSILSYQEHRCTYRIDEAFAFKASKYLVLPSQRNLNFFKDTYGRYIAKKAFIANEDWRPKELINKVYAEPIQKLSSIDNIPRIIILARFVTYGKKKNYRRGNRVNYLEIIQELLDAGAIVHLNCLHIYESLESKNFSKNNPYHLIEKKYPEQFFIDKSYDMEEIDSYFQMKKFDAGILHNYVAGEEVSRFSQMNIPNRFFEYLVSGVKPIVIKNSLCDVEDAINDIGFGVIAESYTEAVAFLKDCVKSSERQDYSKSHRFHFSNYFKILYDIYRKDIKLTKINY
jgi:hypothetical protein